MFAKQFRLPATTLFSHTQFSSSPLVTIKMQKNSLAENRYGFVASKKISKRAHVRNRSKRRLRAVIEALHPTLPKGYDMLFVLKTALIKQPIALLRTDVITVLEKTLKEKII